MSAYALQVRMEFEAMRHKSKQVSDVWTLNPEAREARGDCICNLNLDPGIQSVKSKYFQCRLLPNGDGVKTKCFLCQTSAEWT